MGKKLKITLEVDADDLRDVLCAAAESEEAAEMDQLDEDVEVEVEMKKPAKKASKKAVVEEELPEDEDGAEGSADGDSDDELSEDDEAEDEPKPAKKGKKITVEDVQDACKKKVHSLVERGIAAAEARARVLKILQKNFKVKSVHSLKATQYAEAIEAMS